MIRVAASTARRSSRERAEAMLDPADHDEGAHDGAGERDRPAEQQPVLELVAGAHPIEPAILLTHEIGRVGMGADPERDDLGADDRQQRAGDQRVDVPLAPEHRQPCEHDRLDDRADARHHGARAG